MLGVNHTTVLGPADFSFALASVAMISLLSVPFFLRMSPDAGAEVAGRARKVPVPQPGTRPGAAD